MIRFGWCRSSLLALCLPGVSLAAGASAQTANLSLPDAPTAGLIAIANQPDTESTESGDEDEDQPDQPAQSDPAAAQNPTPSAPQAAQSSAQTQRDKAQQQLKQEEKQRILAVVPNFNTSYISNAAPLSPKQKLSLALRSSIDPFEFFAAGADAGLNQIERQFPAYGEGLAAYGKYFGASYADDVDGTMIGNAFLPILLKQDPRYFRKGTGTIKRRLLYAIATTVWCKNDNQKWGPNYSNVLGNLVAGGISNIYYPPAQRGVGLTLDRGFTVTAEGTIGAIADEFWPDVARKLLKGRYARLQGNIPGATAPPATPPPATPAPATPPPATPPPATPAPPQ